MRQTGKRRTAKQRRRMERKAARDGNVILSALSALGRATDVRLSDEEVDESWQDVLSNVGRRNGKGTTIDKGVVDDGA